MSPWKALGPDGYLVGFYQNSWNIIQKNFLKTMNRLWISPSEVLKINKTDICLILKVNRPPSLLISLGIYLWVMFLIKS